MKYSTMKYSTTHTSILISLASMSVGVVAHAGAQVETPDGQKTLAATMNVYVFPSDGQDALHQGKDEADCYNWAVQNTGTDPFALAKQAEQIQQQGQAAQAQAAQKGKGSGAKGAVAGAAVGALIGEIADDKGGEGAAIGAAAGIIGGRRHARRSQQQASAQASAQTSQAMAANEQQVTNFKKAFSVCLEAKKYLVKY
jgi:hypothetical protein